MSWKLVYTKQAIKDSRKIKLGKLKPQVTQLLRLLEKDPYFTPPPFEKLQGDLSGAYSRRINIQHRLVYQILENIKTVKIIRMWTHYE